jgi:hypothetical protein
VLLLQLAMTKRTELLSAGLLVRWRRMYLAIRLTLLRVCFFGTVNFASCVNKEFIYYAPPYDS